VRALAGQRGLRVPQDLAVVGYGSAREYDDVTGIRFDGTEMGRTAAMHMQYLILERMVRPKRPRLKTVKGTYRAADTHAQAPD
jgi:DNA-binding LacI/PurR family transcriptional regulator